jgi:xanthine dehydrogenase accessory factor
VSDDTRAEIMREVMAAQADGPPLLLVTVVRAPEGGEAPVGAKLLLRRDGSSAGSLGGGPLEAAVVADGPEGLRHRGVQAFFYAADGRRLGRREAEAAADAYQVMMEIHEPPATLVIVGGGHIGKALATMAHLCGFAVVVIDDRTDYANAERFPEAERVICGDFAAVLRDYPIDATTYVVTVTRGHKHDEESLRVVAASPAAYVGMIGSRRRAGAVLQHLVDGGLDPEAAARVHTPIGLDIAAETPEEIAVAIMAEVIQVRRSRPGAGSGRPMREVKGPRRPPGAP